MFAHDTTLVVHNRTHTGEKPYKCTFEGCGKSFSTSDGRRSHDRTHSGDKPYHCDFENCDQSFSQLSILASHKRKHTGEKPYECDYDGCTKSFSENSTLVNHKRVHTGEKPYHCDFENCGKSYSQNGMLINHKRTHSGEKPFICDVDDCGKSFAYASVLSAHKRGHVVSSTFTCDHCTFRSKYPRSLRKHILKHEKQKKYPFECKMQDCGTQLCSQGDIQCSIRTKTERDLDFHIQRNHTIEGIGRKLQSETKLAQFFDAQNIIYDRDWTNLIQFKTCKNIEGRHISARPDFYLPEESVRLKAIVIVGNDEFSHRRYACDFQRLWNICQALEQDQHFCGLPILYIRFNPHYYLRNKIHHDHPLNVSHDVLLKTLKSITSLKPGVNLVYIHYDETDGTLDVFKCDENDFAKIYQDCVLLKI